MKDLERMLELLEQKRLHFLEYEKEMEDLPLLPVEEMEACVERGGVIIDKVKELDDRLNQLLQENGPLALSAVNHDCDRGQLDGALGKLYDVSLGVKAVASRILENDGMIRQRIEYERDLAMEKIKEINTQASSVAGRYQRSTETGARPSAPEWQGREV